jgi:hypothetical protein
MRRWFFLTLFFLTFSLFGQSKYALVIGNGAYTNVSALRNPVNDANDIATTLQSLGFTVEKVLNANLDQMEGAVVRLKNRLSMTSNSYGFFFYAGHGVQSNGENYLIPVDASIASESFLRTKALQVQPVLDELNQANNSLNVIVLDACRDNPFSWARSGTRGLTMVGGQPPGSILVYATSAGSTAADGTGRNGLFTEQLLKNLKTPNLSVRDIFDMTGEDVQRVSNNRQVPAVYSQAPQARNIYFSRNSPAPPPVQPPVNNSPTFIVRNDTGNTWKEVYVSSSSETEWGNNRLNGNMTNGQTLTITLNRALSVQNQYDVKVIYSNGEEYKRNKITITQGGTVSLTRENIVRIAPSPSIPPAPQLSSVIVPPQPMPRGDYNSLHAQGYDYLYMKYLWATNKDPENLDKAIYYDSAAYSLYPEGNAAYELTQAYSTRGLLYYNSAKYALAIADFEKCLSIDSKYAEASSQLTARQYLQLAREKARQ